ncbi:hypothetical protein CAL29_24340 [Bordetella genomosp. 10]|uniref:ABC transporter substrate-binding protein n=1 Tax=Bordetella genomosp. 10 TaxID=1416804 RepID=A0A261S1P7_9BORD|nr:tripartite tricarboxylate transporter substrate-binding protein [Bordetella genomosp. 10]OZI31071.1 hypothetical protein CAL29_24340 [Bordetella genomosp. 10]
MTLTLGQSVIVEKGRRHRRRLRGQGGAGRLHHYARCVGIRRDHAHAAGGEGRLADPHPGGSRRRRQGAHGRVADVPTLAESGFPGLGILEWNGVFVPAKTPPDIVGKLSEAVRNAVADAAVAQRLRGTGMDPVGNSPAEFAVFARHESEQWQALVKARGITVN